jgi:hypothetical protein
VTLEFLTINTPMTPATGAPEVVMTTDFSSFAFTPNQLASANLLDAVQIDPKAAKAANLISFLNAEPFANLPKDFQKISPDGLTAFEEIGFSNANIQKLTLEGRLDDLHNGSNGFSSNMNLNGTTVNQQTGVDGKSSKGVVEPVFQHAPENRWGVWITGFGDFVDVDGDGNAQGYSFTTGGVSVGLDYRLTDQLAIGVFGDYSHTWTSLNPNGHLDVDRGRGGVYATWFNHGLYFNAAIYGGHNNYDSGRAGLGGLTKAAPRERNGAPLSVAATISISVRGLSVRSPRCNIPTSGLIVSVRGVRWRPWRSNQIPPNRSGAMSGFEPFTNGRLERSSSSHRSKPLGNMSTNIRPFRSPPVLPGFPDQPQLSSVRPKGMIAR